MMTATDSQRVASAILEQIGQMARKELGVRAARALDDGRGGVELHLAVGTLVRILLTAEDGRYTVHVSRHDVHLAHSSVGAEVLRETVLRMAAEL
jgi:hypothetical protein